MTRVRTALSLLLALTFVGAPLAAPAPARAAGKSDSGEAASRRHWKRAEAHFRAGRFEQALRAYEAGYQAAPLPGFLINIAQCHRRLGDIRRARAVYQQFVAVAPDSPHRDEVESIVAELDAILAALDDPGKTPGPALPPPVLSRAPVPPDPPAEGAIAASAPPPVRGSREGLFARPWVWTAVTATVVGGAVAVLVISTRKTEPVHTGSLGVLRR